jgi:hypothetical protein
LPRPQQMASFTEGFRDKIVQANFKDILRWLPFVCVVLPRNLDKI